MCFGHLVAGTIIGFPTVALPQLFDEVDSNVSLDEQYGSWFASTFSICGFFMMIPGGILSSKIGRRRTVLLSNPFVIGKSCVIIRLMSQSEVV